MASTDTENNLAPPTASVPAGSQGQPAFLTLDAGIKPEDFQKLYIENQSFGLVFDGGDTNPDRQIVRLRQIAALVATRPAEEKKKLTKIILAEAEKINKMVQKQSEENAKNGTTEHVAFEMPEPVMAEVKTFLKGDGDLSDVYYSRTQDGSGWKTRAIGDLDRDEIGISGDKPHIEEGTSQSGDPMDEDTLTFVAPVCEKEGGESLLAALLRDPKNKETADELAKKLEGPIQKAALDAGVKREFRMPLGQMRSFFMAYVAFGYASKGSAVKEATESRDSQRQAKDAWEALVKRNGYPASWNQSFVAIGDGQVEKAIENKSSPYGTEDVEAALQQHKGYNQLEMKALEDAKKIAAALNECLKNRETDTSADAQQAGAKDDQKSGISRPSNPQSKVKGPPPVLFLPGPALNGNISRFGEISSVKKCGFGWHVFVNAGTSECPVFIVLRGSDFGRGVAEEFRDRFKTSTQDEIKSRKGPDVASISAIVQTSGARPWTYYLVNWDKQRIGEDKADQDFVCETQLKALIGEANVRGVSDDPTGSAGYRQILLAQRQSQEEWIKQCKDEGLHPHTGEPITEEGRAEYPWLFGTTAKTTLREERGKAAGTSDDVNADAASQNNIDVGSGFSIPKAGGRAKGSA